MYMTPLLAPQSMPRAPLLTSHTMYATPCRHCFEVACVPKTVTDRYGEALNRNNVCYDPTRTVVVKIIDRCACCASAFGSLHSQQSMVHQARLLLMLHQPTTCVHSSSLHADHMACAAWPTLGSPHTLIASRRIRQVMTSIFAVLLYLQLPLLPYELRLQPGKWVAVGASSCWQHT
jgi:hypothetical protein